MSPEERGNDTEQIKKGFLLIYDVPANSGMKMTQLSEEKGPNTHCNLTLVFAHRPQ